MTSILPPPPALPNDFETAARDALSFLHERLGFGLWMVTRTEGDDWVVLHTEDHGYELAEGTVLKWADSFCSRMMRGEGPRVAPDSSEVATYADAPIGKQVPIGAYAGVPLHHPDGSLFGTLCAIDPEPQPQRIAEELPLIELIARLLSRVLESEQRLLSEVRRANRAENQALCDPLTGLFNRRGWDRLLTTEASRCQRYASPACVVALDIDGLKAVNDTQGHAAGDAILRSAADALLTSVRHQDLVARVGGDEFLVLGVECDPEGAAGLVQRITDGLAQAGVTATLGLAHHRIGQPLAEAAEAADQALIANKRDRRRA